MKKLIALAAIALLTGCVSRPCVSQVSVVNGFATGDYTNCFKVPLENVKVYVAQYNSTGRQIGDLTSDSTRNLQPGSVWRFRAPAERQAVSGQVVEVVEVPRYADIYRPTYNWNSYR